MKQGKRGLIILLSVLLVFSSMPASLADDINADSGDTVATYAASGNTSTTSVTVEKKWTGYKTIPPSVDVSLYSGDTLQETVTLTAADNWSHTWTKLPKYNGSDLITYDVKESTEASDAANSTPTYSYEDNVNQCLVLAPVTSIEAGKKYVLTVANSSGGRDLIRAIIPIDEVYQTAMPVSDKTLSVNGTDYTNFIGFSSSSADDLKWLYWTASDGGNGSYNFQSDYRLLHPDSLGDVEYLRYDGKQLKIGTSPSGNSSYSFSAKDGGFVSSSGGPTIYAYELKGEADASTVVTINNYYNGTLSQNPDPGTLPQDPNPTETTPQTTSFTVTKAWSDSSASTDTTITLYAGDSPCSSTNPVILPGTDSKGNPVWTYTWNDLPVLDGNENAIDYHAVESEQNGYSASYSTVETETKTVWVPTYRMKDKGQYIITSTPNTGTQQVLSTSNDKKGFTYLDSPKNTDSKKSVNVVSGPKVINGVTYDRYIVADQTTSDPYILWDTNYILDSNGNPATGRPDGFGSGNLMQLFSIRSNVFSGQATGGYLSSQGSGGFQDSVDKRAQFYYGYIASGKTSGNRLQHNDSSTWPFLLGTMDHYLLLINSSPGDSGSKAAQTFYLYEKVEYKEMSQTITNSKTETPEVVNVNVTKTWEGDQETDRPESIKLTLKANGVESETVTVKPDADGNWSYSWKGLRKYQNDTQTPIAYTVEEQAVDGYQAVITPTTDDSGNVNVSIVNTKEIKKIDIKLLKKDGDSGKLLTGAVFKLQKLDDAGNVDSGFTEQQIDMGSESSYTISGLVYGSYRLTEVTPPLGYQGMLEPVEFTISEDGLTVTGNADRVQVGSKQDNTIEMTVLNYQGISMPDTGGNGVSNLIMLGIAVSVIGIGLFIGYKKKNTPTNCN